MEPNQPAGLALEKEVKHLVKMFGDTVSLVYKDKKSYTYCEDIIEAHMNLLMEQGLLKEAILAR